MQDYQSKLQSYLGLRPSLRPESTATDEATSLEPPAECASSSRADRPSSRRAPPLGRCLCFRTRAGTPLCPGFELRPSSPTTTTTNSTSSSSSSSTEGSWFPEHGDLTDLLELWDAPPPPPSPPQTPPRPAELTARLACLLALRRLGGPDGRAQAWRRAGFVLPVLLCAEGFDPRNVSRFLLQNDRRIPLRNLRCAPRGYEPLNALWRPDLIVFGPAQEAQDAVDTLLEEKKMRFRRLLLLAYDDDDNDDDDLDGREQIWSEAANQEEEHEDEAQVWAFRLLRSSCPVHRADDAGSGRRFASPTSAARSPRAASGAAERERGGAESKTPSRGSQQLQQQQQQQLPRAVPRPEAKFQRLSFLPPAMPEVLAANAKQAASCHV